jgi:hypothetical protein
MLSDETVEGSALPEIALVLQGREHLDGGPAETADIAELESARAIDVVLKATLAELKIDR